MQIFNNEIQMLLLSFEYRTKNVLAGIQLLECFKWKVWISFTLQKDYIIKSFQKYEIANLDLK